MYLLHSLPAIAFYLNGRHTDYKLRKDHWLKLFMPLGLIHAIINFVETKRRDEPLLYLKWDDGNSVLVCIIVQVILSL